MPRGKKAIDKNLIADDDLLSFEPYFEAYAAGADCPLTVLQITRFREGLNAQYPEAVPKNKRAEIKDATQTSIEHALGLTCILTGERLAIDTLLELGEISPEAHTKIVGQIEMADKRYREFAATVVLGAITLIKDYLSRKGEGGGRPANRKKYNATDHEIISKVAEKLTPDRGDPVDWVREIRLVVKEYLSDGKLPRRGETDKDSIDIHTQRLTRRSRSAKKPK